MLDITIIAIGKLKERYWQEAFEEFKKRLKPYARMRIIEIAHVPFAGASDKNKAIRSEGEKVLSIVSKMTGAKVQVLTEAGRQFDSLKFARHLEKITQPIVFVIGGSLGLSEEVKQTGENLSLSALTFTHEMARVILAEQLYRAIAIIKNKDYHY